MILGCLQEPIKKAQCRNLNET